MKLKQLYEEITNGRLGVINEASLSRVLQMAQEKDFCIVTGFRGTNTLQQNREKNKQINATLASNGLSGYALIGHWQEAPDGVAHQDANPEDLTDIVEESIMFTKPDDMPVSKFITLCTSLGRRFNQDAVVVGIKGVKPNKAWSKNKPFPKDMTGPKVRSNIPLDDGDDGDGGMSPGVYFAYNDGSFQKIGTSITLGKIAQAYSQMKGKPNIPFVFEGVLQPTNNISRQAFKLRNIKYLV